MTTKQKQGESVPANPQELVGRLRERYGRIAEGIESGCCSSTGSACRIGYSQQHLDTVPDEANLGLGCGAPIRFLDLKPGETLVDLGSGGGLDAFIAAPLVGAKGRVIGVDMTPEMIQRATEAAARTGESQVEFRQGRLEALPLEDASVDAVTSNCVINLVPDKAQVFREVARVLRPGGRLVVSDILLEGALPGAVERDLLAYVGCLAGALQRETYFANVRAAGLGQIEILEDIDYLAAAGDNLPAEAHELIDRTGVRVEDLQGVVHSVTFRAVKP